MGQLGAVKVAPFFDNATHAMSGLQAMVTRDQPFGYFGDHTRSDDRYLLSWITDLTILKPTIGRNGVIATVVAGLVSSIDPASTANAGREGGLIGTGINLLTGVTSKN